MKTTYSRGEKIGALKDAGELGELRNSITRGEGNLAAFIGERVAARVTGAHLYRTYEYDLVLGRDIKIDVKTKRTTVDYVKPHYEASIAEYNTRQQCDIYLFTRVNLMTRSVWLLGWMSKEEYFRKARYLKAGTVDGSNGFVVKANCYNLPYSQLRPIEELKDYSSA